MWLLASVGFLAACFGDDLPPAKPEVLAAAIRSLSRDINLAEQLGHRGRLYALDHFAQDRNLRFFEEVLKTIAAGGRPGTSILATTSGI